MKLWRKPLDSDQVSVPRGEVLIFAEQCKGCGFCVEFCPKEVLALSEEFNHKGYHPPIVIKNGECVNCHLCEMICPDFAIFSVPIADEMSTEAQDAPAQPTEDTSSLCTKTPRENDN